MDTLIGKLTDLAYEFFGVILPGFFFLLLLTLWWHAAGGMIFDRTAGHIHFLTVDQIGRLDDTISRIRRVEIGVLILVLCYFLGQLLNWGSKPKPKAPGADQGQEKERTHWAWFLAFRASKPNAPLPKDLVVLRDEASKRLSADGEALSWGQFYRVAKTLIAQNLKYSLVQTYQHKYTLHRCVAVMAAVLFWLCTLAAALWLVMRDGTGPNWYLLVALTMLSLWMVKAFARSYTYFWGLWGEAIVTEAYSLVCAPNVEGTSGTKK